MATTTIVDTNQDTTYELDASNHTWVFAESHFFTGTPTSIHQASNLTNDMIVINGDVHSSAVRDFGISLAGTNSSLIIGNGGTVVADQAIGIGGSGMLVRNDGLVNAVGMGGGIEFFGADAHAINNGAIYGQLGIWIGAEGGIVENNGSIHASFYGIQFHSGNATATFGENSVIAADYKGVVVSSTAGQTSTITNSGLIATGGATAFESQDGDEILINHGTIRGKVSLGAGSDVFNNLDGKYSGEIYGGAGDDIFVINSTKTKIYENTGDGSDLVKSTVSFSLNTQALAMSEIENLTLLGSKNINATGNALANTIMGNKGDNVLDGGLGNDALIGGKGHDTFVFATNDNVDEAIDFHAGIDKVDLSGVVGNHGFKDMLKNHVSESDGLLHITYGTDQLDLDHVTKADLRASDFIF